MSDGEQYDPQFDPPLDEMRGEPVPVEATPPDNVIQFPVPVEATPPAPEPEAEPVDDVAAADAAECEGKPFTLLRWNGIRMYRCRACPFDSLDEPGTPGEFNFYQHYSRTHLGQPDPADRSERAGSVLVDRFGNALT